MAKRPDLLGARGEYLAGKLTRESLADDPVDQFRTWMADAVETGMHEPNAVVLSTVATDGQPSSRMVLLKSFDEHGFVFTTNYGSRKGRELDGNPKACLLFYWPSLERQARIEGVALRTSVEESDAIFEARPRGSRLGAHASSQSREIVGRETLETRLRELDKQYPEAIPRPESWGGYRLAPIGFEFWQGRAHRLHDRFRFDRAPDGGWTVKRLAP